MDLRRIALDDLAINSANDRHGELDSETAAIAWLFNEREQHMRNLTKDIVRCGEVFELPLVVPSGKSFLVFDGNRRVTCLKMLASPSQAPTSVLRDFFRDQRANWIGEFPTEIECQVETDRDRIDEILFRRHTGTQQGIGQSTWDDRMKRNFVDRTGRSGAVTLADGIESLLQDEGLLPARKIPRSTLNRLLSAEALRNKVGVSFKNNRFHIIGNRQEVLSALSRIATDLAERELVLGNIWDTKGKLAYLEKLEYEGTLPTTQVAQPKFPGLAEVAAPRTSRVPLPKPHDRRTLIPNRDYGVRWSGTLQRVNDIWDELQFRLLLDQHPNAISVMLRVLIELSVEHYITVRSVHIQPNDKLSNKLEKAANGLLAEGLIDKRDLQRVKKFQNHYEMISTDTLNRFVHSYKLSPTKDQLTAIWDSVADIVVHCLNAQEEQK